MANPLMPKMQADRQGTGALNERAGAKATGTVCSDLPQTPG